ncbi:hypothetical protein C5167_017593 [Papaver somniferum]|uniref:Uncharacterized protein n=1 Tax=Papaver somniferum TaxID=3469 RepID=A0A4Y7INY2_PAPSO|nr:hypothetical protein C5167_017593 [Papaver somniferum]
MAAAPMIMYPEIKRLTPSSADVAERHLDSQVVQLDKDAGGQEGGDVRTVNLARDRIPGIPSPFEERRRWWSQIALMGLGDGGGVNVDRRMERSWCSEALVIDFISGDVGVD